MPVKIPKHACSVTDMSNPLRSVGEFLTFLVDFSFLSDSESCLFTEESLAHHDAAGKTLSTLKDDIGMPSSEESSASPGFPSLEDPWSRRGVSSSKSEAVFVVSVVEAVHAGWPSHFLWFAWQTKHTWAKLQGDCLHGALRFQL